MAGTKDKPLWTMMVRPPRSREPWEPLNVPAESALQAEAILRRTGYDVWECSPGLAKAKGLDTKVVWDNVVENAALRCVSCSYPLDSLSIDVNRVTCTECGRAQRLFTYIPKMAIPWYETGTGQAAILALAMIGLLVVCVVGLAILSAFV